MRLEITRRAELAVRALGLLTADRRRWKAPELASALTTTVGFVPQVVGPLVRAGWVRSDPGPLGGYTSRVAVGEVDVLAVIEAVDGATDAGRCVVADRPCRHDAPCVLHSAWTQARGELLRVLAATPVDAGVPPSYATGHDDTRGGAALGAGRPRSVDRASGTVPKFWKKSREVA